MFFTMTRPCKNCPFLASKYFPLNPGRRAEIAASLLCDQSFPCHQTTKFDDEGEQVITGKEQFCVGALITMAKQDILHHHQMVRIADRLGLFSPENLNLNAPVYSSLDDFARDERAKNNGSD